MGYAGCASLCSTLFACFLRVLMVNFNVLETCRYVPTKYAPSPASAQQAALAKVKSLESLDVIGKLVRNIVVAPAEEKFRRVKLTNAKVRFMRREGPIAFQNVS